MKVAVVGIGIIPFGENWKHGIRDMLADVQIAALEDAKMSEKDISQIYTGSMCSGEFTGQEHLGAMAAENLNINVPSARIEAACASGGTAIRAGLQAIESGNADIVMVNGVEKMTDISTEAVTSGLMGAGDEEWEEFHGFTFPSLYSLMARAHMNEFGTTSKQLASVSVKSHKHGSLSPYAQYKNEITVEQVLNSTMIADPLTLLDCSPITDGAASAILTKPELAKKYSDTPVYITGSSSATDTLALHARESLSRTKSASIAAENAYKQAGISVNDVNLFEVHDCFSIAELMAMESLQIVKQGASGAYAEAGNTYFDSKTPINTSGGLKAAGHPVGATGIKQLYEVVTQLRNEADKRQVPKAEVALTHNVGGSGATTVVHILRR